MCASSSYSTWHSGERDTLLHAFSRVCAEAPDRIFIDIDGRQISYGEFNDLSTAQAHALKAMGVKPGDTVVTMLDNNFDAVCLWFAINRANAIAVPLNTALKGEFLRHQIADSGAALMVAESDYVARISQILSGLPDLQMLLIRGGMPLYPLPASLRSAALEDHRGIDTTPIAITAKPSDISCVIYTSGTTGPSKGAMQPYNFFCNLARTRLSSSPVGPQDITYTPMPLFHNNALATGIAGSVLSGGTIAIAPRFSVSSFWKDVERTGATIVSLVGSMATLLAEAPDSPEALRCYGQIHTVRGVPFSDRVKDLWRKRFGATYVGSNDYGMTEVAVVTWLKGGEYAPPNSSGKRFPDFDLRIVDDEDIEVPEGTAGEIIIRPNKPDIMFKGYWRRPEATVTAMRNQWFHTGDIGRFDQDGFFYFVDRKKDYLKRRGENISSFEMEVALKAHPAILDVAVHAVASEFGDDEVKVTAVLRDAHSLHPEEYCLWIADRVPYFAVPRFIEFRDSLPKNPQDKILKFKLREDGVTPSTWDREMAGLKIVKR